MIRALASPSPNPRPVSITALAIPAEHGGWGFVAEPLLLGLLAAPSGRGAALALAAVFAFLARHPTRLVLADRRRGRTYPRTRVAARFALGYGSLAALALAGGTWGAPPAVWAPFAAAAPLALLQLRYDVRLRGRELAAELLGATAAGSSAAAIAIAGNWPPAGALALWLALALRAVASVLYVRARLRLDRGSKADRTPAWVSHAAGLLVVGALVALGLTGWPALLAFAALLARAVHGLWAGRPAVRPQVLGFQELGYGLLTAVMLALR